jgi:hypothetical protein
MPTPDDALEVICALRLGWYIAEVRGRNWPAGPQTPLTASIYELDARTQDTLAAQSDMRAAA